MKSLVPFLLIISYATRPLRSRAIFSTLRVLKFRVDIFQGRSRTYETYKTFALIISAGRSSRGILYRTACVSRGCCFNCSDAAAALLSSQRLTMFLFSQGARNHYVGATLYHLQHERGLTIDWKRRQWQTPTVCFCEIFVHELDLLVSLTYSLTGQSVCIHLLFQLFEGRIRLQVSPAGRPAAA